MIEEKRQKAALQARESQPKPTESSDNAPAEAAEKTEQPEQPEQSEFGSPEALQEEADQQGAFNPETGEINWDCPCLGGMAHGPCGEEFRAAFSCFVYSTEEPKGMDCIDKFQYDPVPDGRAWLDHPPEDELFANSNTGECRSASSSIPKSMIPSWLAKTAMSRVYQLKMRMSMPNLRQQQPALRVLRNPQLQKPLRQLTHNLRPTASRARCLTPSRRTRHQTPRERKSRRNRLSCSIMPGVWVRLGRAAIDH